MFKNLSTREREGECYIYFASFLWAFFPIVTLLSFNTLSSFYTLAFSSFFAALFFAIILTLRKKWVTASWETFKHILVGTFSIGVFYYLFIFKGMERTSAGNAAIFFQMEIFFSFVFFNLWKKESIPKKHLWGAFLMLISAVILIFPEELKLNHGDLIIILGTAIAPVGNFYMQKAMKKVSSEYIMFLRSIIAFPVVLFFAWFFGESFSLSGIKESFPFLLLNGVLLFGLSKIFWLEAIHRIPVTKAISLTTIGPFFTLIFAYFILKDVPTFQQLLAIIPMILGIIFITSKVEQK